MTRNALQIICVYAYYNVLAWLKIFGYCFFLQSVYFLCEFKVFLLKNLRSMNSVNRYPTHKTPIRTIIEHCCKYLLC